MQAFYKKDKIRKKRVSLYFWRLYFICDYFRSIESKRKNDQLYYFSFL